MEDIRDDGFVTFLITMLHLFIIVVYYGDETIQYLIRIVNTVW